MIEQRTDITEPASARAARKRRQSAERRPSLAPEEAREPRAAAAGRGCGDLRSDGFLIARHRRDGVNIAREADGPVIGVAGKRRVSAIDPADIAVLAALILEREGFAPSAAQQLVTQRLRPREEHSWPDHMPSLRPGPMERMRQAYCEEGWTTPPHLVFDVMNGRSPAR